MKEAEPEHSGVGSLLTGVKAAEAVKQLCSGSALGLDEIFPSS